MCVVSMIGDHYRDKWTLPGTSIPSSPFVTNPNSGGTIVLNSGVSKEEFEALRKEVLEMKELLLRAVEYDKRNNEPHCEMEEKVSLLKKVAEIFGVSLDDVFGTDK